MGVLFLNGSDHNGQRARNAADPSGDQDLSTKKYTDAKAALGNQSPMLTHLAQRAATGPARVVMYGTSIATFDQAPNQVLAESLKTHFGDAGIWQQRAGELGGSNEAAYNGWTKQTYGGPYYVRAVGTSSATPILICGYGDQAVIEYSLETDSQPGAVQVDGGTAQTLGGTATTQSYSNRAVVALGSLGAHTVAINPPSSGKFYLESIEIRSTIRTGVEVIDRTFGGSKLGDMATVKNGTGAQTTGAAIVGDNGVNAHFDRSDVDLFIVSFVVNDAGSGYWPNPYQGLVDKIVAKTAAAGQQVVFIIEMAGHYALPIEYGNGNGKAQFDAIRAYLLTLTVNPHVTVIDHHAATIMADLAAYGLRYYGITNLNLANGTWSDPQSTGFIHSPPTTDGPSIGTVLIHQAAGLVAPRRATANLTRADRERTLPITLGRDRAVTMEGVTKRYQTAAGIAMLTLANGGDAFPQYQLVPYYRDSTPTNLTPATQVDISNAGTSDTYGAYKVVSDSNVYLPSGPNYNAGATRMLTIRGRGTIAIRSNNGARLYAGTSLIPLSDASSTSIRLVVPDNAPQVIAVRVGQPTGSNGYLTISGTLYDLAITDTDQPVLTAAAATGSNGGVVTASPPLLGSVANSGLWSPPTVFGALSTSALTAATEYVVPFLPLRSGTVTQIGVDVTTAAASGIARMGIYDADAASQPGTLLSEGTGQAATSSTGYKTITLATPVAVTAGKLYWLAIACQGAAFTIRTVLGISPYIAPAASAVTASSALTGGGVTGSLYASGSGNLGSPVAFAPFLRALIA